MVPLIVQDGPLLKEGVYFTKPTLTDLPAERPWVVLGVWSGGDNRTWWIKGEGRRGGGRLIGTWTSPPPNPNAGWGYIGGGRHLDEARVPEERPGLQELPQAEGVRTEVHRGQEPQ